MKEERKLCRACAWLATLALVASAVLACGSPPEVPPEFGVEPTQDEDYRIAPADLVRVVVWKNPDLNVEAPVLPDGTLTVPLAGQVEAAGLTAGELEDLIAYELTEYITTTEVSVIVRDVRGKRVAVLGEVKRPGSYPLPAELRVVDAIATAGGFTPFANKRKVRLVRMVEGRTAEFRFNYNAFTAGDAPETNVVLLPGDLIVVPD